MRSLVGSWPGHGQYLGGVVMGAVGTVMSLGMEFCRVGVVFRFRAGGVSWRLGRLSALVLLMFVYPRCFNAPAMRS